MPGFTLRYIIFKKVFTLFHWHNTFISWRFFHSTVYMKRNFDSYIIFRITGRYYASEQFVHIEKFWHKCWTLYQNFTILHQLITLSEYELWTDFVKNTKCIFSYWDKLLRTQWTTDFLKNDVLSSCQIVGVNQAARA